MFGCKTMAMIPIEAFPHISGQVPTLYPARIIEKWKYASHPDLRKLEKRAETLLSALDSIFPVTVEWGGLCETEDEIESCEEKAEFVLDTIRVLLLFLNGVAFKRVLRNVRRYRPTIAEQLRISGDTAISKLREGEQSILYCLDEDVESEWLPDPAPPGALPPDEDGNEILFW